MKDGIFYEEGKGGQVQTTQLQVDEVSVIGFMVEGILATKTLKHNKVSYRSQKLWLEAVGPLVACLEKAYTGTL